MLETKKAADHGLAAAGDEIIRLSHEIHSHPELAFEEERAATWLGAHLDAAGFRVEQGAYALPTSFVASIGTGPLHLVLCAEYDALPGMGHACGHNMIAAMSVGAAIALSSLVDDLGLRVTVLGTPGEEACDGGGKILLLERGAFDDVHAAMMLHPYTADIAGLSTLASAVFDLSYTGVAAHAAAFPHQGINAAAALSIAETAIAHLRMHLLPTQRVNGIVTYGGAAPNIIPEHTSARYLIRAATLAELKDVKARVVRCFEAGAIASGCSFEVVGGERPYAQLVPDPDLSRVYQANAEELGRKFAEGPSGPFDPAPASTDMGNVSLVVPSLHPFMGIDAGGAVNHQPEFARFCASGAADDTVMEGAALLAHTAIDIALDSELRSRLLARVS